MALTELEQLMWREADEQRKRFYMAEKTVIQLRRMLRSSDPSLPNEYDGAAWQPIEARWET